MSLDTISILHSLAGCEQQQLHKDYADDECGISCLLAICEGTRIVIDHGDNYRPLELNVGQCVFFKGDVVHAGAGYDAENIRLHAYYDSGSRRDDYTYLV